MEHLPPKKREELEKKLDHAVEILAKKEEEKHQREAEEAALMLRDEL